jgi:chromosome segregation ATPase
MVAEYEILKEDIHEFKSDVKTDIRSIRDRLHKSENNIASSSALLKETTTNLTWVIQELEKFNEMKERIDKLSSDIILDRENRLKDKITKLQKFWDGLFSYKTFCAAITIVVVIAYFSDLLSLSHHINNIRGVKNG